MSSRSQRKRLRFFRSLPLIRRFFWFDRQQRDSIRSSMRRIEKCEYIHFGDGPHVDVCDFIDRHLVVFGSSRSGKRPKP